MKSLTYFRIPLQLFVAMLYQLFFLDTTPYPLIILTAAYAAYFLILILTAVFNIVPLKHSRILLFTDVIISPLFFLYIKPLWLILLIIIQAISIVFTEKDNSRMYLYLLLGISAAGLLAHFAADKDYISMLLIAPSLVMVILLFKAIWKANSERNKDYDYLKTLIDNKNRLLSTLTHELRTPLAVIKTSNELLLEGRPGPINETQKSLLSSSIENTTRLTSLVENILSQVKVEFSWFSMEKTALDIRPLIRKIANDIKPYLETRKQTIHVNYPGLLSKTMADGRWLQQVLLNLIHNGSKNSAEGSVLEISVKENEQCIVVSVHDSGMGIQNKEISSVFNEFYQSQDPSKNLNDGAGLGLTIVKNIIEKHGGQVYISSIPNTGTTVSFTLPVYKGVFSEAFNSHH